MKKLLTFIYISISFLMFSYNYGYEGHQTLYITQGSCSSMLGPLGPVEVHSGFYEIDNNSLVQVENDYVCYGASVLHDGNGNKGYIALRNITAYVTDIPNGTYCSLDDQYYNGSWNTYLMGSSYRGFIGASYDPPYYKLLNLFKSMEMIETSPPDIKIDMSCYGYGDVIITGIYLQ